MVCSLLYARLLGPDSEFLELPVGHGSHQESSDWNRTDGQSYKMYSKCKCADKSDENPQTEADLNAMGGCLFTYSGEDASFSFLQLRGQTDESPSVASVWKKFGVSFIWWCQSFLGWAKGSRAHSDLTLLMLNKSLKCSLQSSKCTVFWVLFVYLGLIPGVKGRQPQQIGGIVKPAPDSFDARLLIWDLISSEEGNWG